MPAVITTRSPSADEAAGPRRLERLRPQVLDVGGLLDRRRRHAPLDRRLPERVVVVREREDQPAGTEPRHRRGRPAREGRDEDRLGAQRFRDVAGRVRHRLADGRLVARLRQLVPVVEARLDGARDAVHVRDRLDRELAHRGLAGEHERRAAVEDRIRDIARLGPGRIGVVDHRLEHLGRGDHRPCALERGQDDPLLDAAGREQARSRRRDPRGRP